MAQKTFTFEFEDMSPRSIAYECDGTERLYTSVEAGSFRIRKPRRDAALAKLFIKMAMGEYKQGFHIHLRSDFSGDAAQPDILTVLLDQPADHHHERL